MGAASATAAAASTATAAAPAAAPLPPPLPPPLPGAYSLKRWMFSSVGGMSLQAEMPSLRALASRPLMMASSRALSTQTLGGTFLSLRGSRKHGLAHPLTRCVPSGPQSEHHCCEPATATWCPLPLQP